MKNEPQNGMDFERSELEPKEKKNLSLYNIKENYLKLMEDVEESEGVLSEEMIHHLEINEKQLQNKSLAYTEVIKTKESFNLMIDEEIKRLSGIKKRNNTLIDVLKMNLLNAVELFGEFKVGTLTFGTRKSSVLIIENEELIPKKYKIKTVTEKIDKMAIKKDLKTMDIPSCFLQENKNLSIK